jgi:TonB family protein
MNDAAFPASAEQAGADVPDYGIAADGAREAHLASPVVLPGLEAGPRAVAASRGGDRRFQVGLGVAVVLHSLMFAGVFGSPPRNIGDPSGSDDAINVALVTDAELRSLSAVQDSRPKGPLNPPAPPPKPPVEAASAPPTPAPPTPPEPPTPAQTQAPEPPPPPEAVDEKALTLAPIEDLVTPIQRKPEPKQAEPAPPKQEPPERTEKAKPQRDRTAMLDLSPPTTFSAPGGGGAGLQRPPGITRSGENDAFARGVVSALQRTMPQLNDTRGRVTVRIILDRDGSLVSTQVVRPSNITGLDRYVVFATRQTSYPFPPKNAKSDDLVFLITYIYN